jgi:trk system potassium uptake protein TrkH
MLKKIAHIASERIVLLSIFFTILIGTLLLALPICQHTPTSLIDLFFTATSATCVTGLLTIPLDHFTIYGKCVILALIQIGGIGLITMTLFAMSLFIDLGLATQLIAGKLLEFDSWQNIRKFLIFIIIITLSIELLGALAMLPILLDLYNPQQAIFFSVFHAVSSFCSAGFTLFSGNMEQFQANYAMLFITAVLVFFGGLGFITIHEIVKSFTAWREKKRYVFSLHSKIVLYGTFATIFIFTVLFWALEHTHSLSKMALDDSMGIALFNAIVLRSVGFLSIAVQGLQPATLLLIVIMAFIGSAPGSTGSGVKITTIALFLATMKAAVTGRNSVELRGRSIAKDQIYKSIAIIAIALFIIVATTFCLLITEKKATFIALFFEAVAAFTNLGVSLGITPFLTTFGKICIILSMIGGRIGALTLILALRKKPKTEHPGFSYPEERVMLT